MKGISYTQRTLRYLRELGIVCDMAERFLPYAGKFGVKKDLFGFIDIVALDPKYGIIGVQSTSGGLHSAHKKKILEEANENALAWLKCGGVIWLLSWKKKKVVRGGKAMRWFPRCEDINIEHFLTEKELKEYVDD
ncbi:MAG: hypothetical protein KKI02_12840 [Planctomycetes bacterium]|nr:hypothetical protein [Planctomycetota bacterium]